MFDALHQAGNDDNQLSGFVVDSQYIKMGVLTTHNLNLSDVKVREKSEFEWLFRFTNIIQEITGLLNIGKGLEQMLDAAKDLEMKSYKLQGYCPTRFAAYFEVSLVNFIKTYPIIIQALAERKESKNKKVRNQAEKLFSQILDIKFVGILLGCRDIYRVIATTYSWLQLMEQFPWVVTKTLSDIIKLSAMADNLDIGSVKAKFQQQTFIIGRPWLSILMT